MGCAQSGRGGRACTRLMRNCPPSKHDGSANTRGPRPADIPLVRLDQRTGVRTTPIQDAEAILEGESVRLQPDAAPLPGGFTRHTTLSMLVTNVAFPRELLRQMGRQVHSSMARAIQPFHTPDDGDILFTASTGEVAGEGIDSTALGVIASELAWDAVLSSFEPMT